MSLAEKPNTTVYKHVHDIVFTPWPSEKVAQVTKVLVQKTLSDNDADKTRREVVKDDELRYFSEHYKVFFMKLTDPEFVTVPRNVQMTLKLIQLKQDVERGKTSEVDAAASASSMALTGLLPS